MHRLLAVALIAGIAGQAHADGVYFSQSVGVGMARGELQPMVGNTIRTRLGIGARVRWLAIEPWVQSDVQSDRDGAFAGFLGGEPAAGRADLETYGFDVKLIAPLYRAPAGERVEFYVRGGPYLATANGALEGFRGYGVGAGAGIQITGQVRALGFLWAPLFLLKRGPKVAGALYLDQGIALARLRNGETQLDARIGHVTVGFGLGSTF